ncbi:MAG TPA: SDR family NAD(P)-dependent oxidoreductase, partial [Anaerolineae bacterium]
MGFQDKVALVTGAGSGIGRATACRFAREGASVVVCDVDEAGVQETAHLITQARGKVFVAPGNVAHRSDAQRIVDAAVAQFGRLDILINNAGITRDGLTVR